MQMYSWMRMLILAVLGPLTLSAQSLPMADYIPANYDKQEVYIPMRDGTRLFTAIYTPKDIGPYKQYPMLMNRTCYSVRPYGEENFATRRLGPSETLIREGYIFVHQDVRGRWMSEGTWTNMTPHLAKKKGKKATDESSDTWDTIEWLLENVANHNGRVGQWGISYPGFYTAATLADPHPALKASSPQAPIADFYFDDFHHNGAYTLSYFRATGVFGFQKTEPTQEPWYTLFDKPTEDGYQFYLDLGPLSNGDAYMGEDNFFWEELKTHPDYDEFWQARNLLPHLKGWEEGPAVMTVGGWFDAEDLYGPLNIYKTLERSPAPNNMLVMGPFGHGGWAREKGNHMHHQVYFGDSIATFYQREIEARFFGHYLKGEGAEAESGLPDAYVYDTGAKEWRTFSQWPPEEAQAQDLFLGPDKTLSLTPVTSPSPETFISDPNQPVPYTWDVPGSFGFTPRNYMSEDQRFASRRPDVLVFETEELEEAMMLTGEIEVELFVSTTGTDADWVVKLIDVYPGSEENTPYTPSHVRMSHYQQLVRGEIMRGRYREGFEQSVPMQPNEVTPIRFRLQDVCHTFKPGHKLMIQVQSSWFPLFDRNPQTFVPNIFEAEEEDFQAQTHSVYLEAGQQSRVQVQVLKK